MDDLARVEYVAEMGRTRTGTRKEARDAEMARRKTEPKPEQPVGGSSYAEVMWVFSRD